MTAKFKAKDKLRAYWSKKENDLMLYHPAHKCDGHYLAGILSKTVTQGLESRGFDLMTLKFEISPKVPE